MLTLTELERRAYLAGLTDVASAYARLEDCEAMQEEYEDIAAAASELLLSLDDDEIELPDGVKGDVLALERALGPAFMADIE